MGLHAAKSHTFSSALKHLDSILHVNFAFKVLGLTKVTVVELLSLRYNVKIHGCFNPFRIFILTSLFYVIFDTVYVFFYSTENIEFHLFSDSTSLPYAANCSLMRSFVTKKCVLVSILTCYAGGMGGGVHTFPNREIT